MDVPSEALEALARATSRSKRTATVAFPVGYVKRADDLPTSARLFRSDDVRLKVHMTLVMQATSFPKTLPARPTRSMAEMLNLPRSTGARRVNAAMNMLSDAQLVQNTKLDDGRRGLLLLNPDGSGHPWKADGDRYITVPFGFWTKGWVIGLSGRAVAVMLALLELNGGRAHSDGAFMDGHRKAQYGLSDDTWTRATHELEAYGLLRTKQVRFGDDEFEVRRRKRYKFVGHALTNTPDWSRMPFRDGTDSGDG